MRLLWEWSTINHHSEAPELCVREYLLSTLRMHMPSSYFLIIILWNECFMEQVLITRFAEHFNTKNSGLNAAARNAHADIQVVRSQILFFKFRRESSRRMRCLYRTFQVPCNVISMIRTFYSEAASSALFTAFALLLTFRVCLAWFCVKTRLVWKSSSISWCEGKFLKISTSTSRANFTHMYFSRPAYRHFQIKVLYMAKAIAT